MQVSIDRVHKPIPLRVVFILNALMMILPFGFYYVITKNDINLGDLDPLWMVYTGIAYITSFIFLVYSFVNRKIKMARAVFLMNIAIAIPAGAYLGILVAVISLAISFLNKKVLKYFNA